MVLTQQLNDKLRATCYIRVSIPLWFSRNAEEFGIKISPISPFPYHYGSHATREEHYDYSENNIVSIPLWFSRNHGRKSWTSSGINCFHTTMVLTQRNCSAKVVRAKLMFPYHYGSHATHIQRGLLCPVLRVSIPLWFSRNPKKTFRLFQRQ